MPDHDLWKLMVIEGFKLSEIQNLAEKITLLDNKQLEEIILKQAIEINRLKKELEKLKESKSK